MSEPAASPRDDLVSRQYERWSYPHPIADVGSWLEHHWEWFDPAHACDVLWPAGAPERALDILIAGCGTNQAAVLAYTNPDARILAIDVSEASLAHEERLKQKHALWNLELRAAAIEELPTLGRTFDLILSTGVLHHLKDPVVGLAALRDCLRPAGVIGVMLYGVYGRTGIEPLRSAFQAMGLTQDPASIASVRRVLSHLDADHPAARYLRSAPDLQSDAGIVDTFLHGRVREYDVAQCLQLVQDAGLNFQGWLLNAPYHPHDLAGTTDDLGALVDGLPEALQWSVIERIRAKVSRHFFMACHPERPRRSYRIDFDAQAARQYVPKFRQRCSVGATGVVGPNGQLRLDPAHLPILRAVDGKRSIAQIVQGLPASRADGRDVERFALRLFRELWRLDFIAVGLPALD